MTDEGKAAIIEKLLAAPLLIAQAEQRFVNACALRDDAKRVLQDALDGLLLQGACDGKNAETRAAQLRLKTAPLQAELDSCEMRVANRRVDLNRATNEFSALRATARILGGME